MCVVRFNGRDYDLTGVERAIDLAWDKARCEDTANARKNGSDEVRLSPLTEMLETAYYTLTNMRMNKPDVSAVGS